jgi:hypothetical protein
LVPVGHVGLGFTQVPPAPQTWPAGQQKKKLPETHSRDVGQQQPCCEQAPPVQAVSYAPGPHSLSYALHPRVVAVQILAAGAFDAFGPSAFE